MARDDPQLKLRLPAELRSRIRARAARSGTSMNQEILNALETQFPRSRTVDEDAGNLLFLLRLIRENEVQLGDGFSELISGISKMFHDAAHGKIDGTPKDLEDRLYDILVERGYDDYLTSSDDE